MAGEETCFHKINRCDLFAQCDPVEGFKVAEDEVAPPLEDPPARGEFSLVAVPAFKLTACQEPEQWGPDMFDEEAVEQADEVILILNRKTTS